jgi:hypothetical protein
MLKKPKAAKVKSMGATIVAIVGGAMAARGVETLVPVNNPTISKAAILALGLGLSLAYDGPQKGIVKDMGIGMAASKTMDLVQETARKFVMPKANPNAIEAAGYATLGLTGSCACNEAYPGMGNPGQASIAEVVYTDTYTPYNTQEVSHTVMTGV